MKNRQPEHEMQVALFRWAAYSLKQYPELNLMFAIPNGGARNIVVAKKLKAEGVKRGVPDIFLPVPRGTHAGLFIEMKAGKNKLTLEQKEWAQGLLSMGYHVVLCYSWEEAVEIIKTYLGDKKDDIRG